jgi:molecular chaperone GrpE (heat shock protein)
MTTNRVPKTTKWPYLLGDVLLLGLAGWIVARQPHPLAPVPLCLVAGCVLAGAWLCVMPFRAEYDAARRLAESDSLTTIVGQISRLQAVADQISLATAQWQTVQEQCAKATTAANEVGERMATEARSFAEFMQKANDSEKAHLRLEVEKLHRGEGDWLQIVVRLLDHVFGLYQAGVRSGQPKLCEQLGNFQNACRDIARRIGLVPVEANGDELFDQEKHQILEANGEPPADARIAETVATGYTYQGRLLRRPIVRLKSGATASAPETEPQLELGAGS